MIPAGQIFVIGDSHIGLSPGSERPIVDWLDSLQRLAPSALYLNGDVFHYLIADPKFHTESVAIAFARMRRLRDGGTEVHYVEGNRDFFLHGSFVEEAVTDIALQYEIRAGGKRYLIVHGDMINERDWPYRFWRRASKNPLSKFALNFIPRRVARRFVDSVEARLARSNFKHKARLPLEMMAEFGRKRSADGYDFVVLGHFHEKTEVPAGGATVAVLPPWYESHEAMVISPDSGEYQYVTI
jgi:UDP-2,3-diacylglucosamine hydrolase